MYVPRKNRKDYLELLLYSESNTSTITNIASNDMEGDDLYHSKIKSRHRPAFYIISNIIVCREILRDRGKFVTNDYVWNRVRHRYRAISPMVATMGGRSVYRVRVYFSIYNTPSVLYPQ